MGRRENVDPIGECISRSPAQIWHVLRCERRARKRIHGRAPRLDLREREFLDLMTMTIQIGAVPAFAAASLTSGLQYKSNARRLPKPASLSMDAELRRRA